jgi:hypothetical protein
VVVSGVGEFDTGIVFARVLWVDEKDIPYALLAGMVANCDTVMQFAVTLGRSVDA